jgi:hypothetical protein
MTKKFRRLLENLLFLVIWSNNLNFYRIYLILVKIKIMIRLILYLYKNYKK